jgi:hypothetical protein
MRYTDSADEKKAYPLGSSSSRLQTVLQISIYEEKSLMVRDMVLSALFLFWHSLVTGKSICYNFLFQLSLVNSQLSHLFVKH